MWWGGIDWRRRAEDGQMSKGEEALKAIEPVSGGSRGTVAGIEPHTTGDAGTKKAVQPAHTRKTAHPAQARTDAKKAATAANSKPKSLTPAGHEALRRWYEAKGLQLTIQREGENGKMVAVLINPATGKIVRQVPLEDLLRLAQSIEQYQGVLVDRTQ